MQRLFLLFLVGLFLVPTTAGADTGKFMCPFAHFIRFGGTETREAIYIFLNGSEKDPVTIERLTIRNAFGDVVHDSGPVTVIAPLGGDFIRTTQIWGRNSIPDLITGEPNNQQGFSGSAVVEFSTAGEAAVKSFRVMVNRRIRERFTDPDGNFSGEGEERVSTRNYCFRIDIDD